MPTTRPLGPGDVGRREPGSDAVGVERACATVGDALVCAAATSLERRLSDWPDRRRACRCRSVDQRGTLLGFRGTIFCAATVFLPTKRGKLYTCVVLKFRKKTFFRLEEKIVWFSSPKKQNRNRLKKESDVRGQVVALKRRSGTSPWPSRRAPPPPPRARSPVAASPAASSPPAGSRR